MIVRNRPRLPPLMLGLALAIMSGGSPSAAGQPADDDALHQAGTGAPSIYSIKTSDVSVPAGVALGQYRRITRPFPNWTLICDENIAKKQKICNITQTIVDAGGNTVFGWSLAASESGKPFFIVRTPPTLAKDPTIRIAVPDKGLDVSVPLKGCDAKACVGYQEVGPRLRTAIDKKLTLTISYNSGSPSGAITMQVPLDGLSAALAAI